MNGRKENDLDIEKLIDKGTNKRSYDNFEESYEPTINELDDDNPPSEDSDSSDSSSE